MIGALTRILFKSAGGRSHAKYRSVVEAINRLEPELAALPDADLKARTAWLRNEIACGRRLDDVLVPAFAAVREAARRTIGLRPFDVQLIGGMVLHEGRIAEVATGEGKTLTATLPAYLNALAGQGVHIATVNDYLAKRDAEWMGRVYAVLGLSVGVVTHDLDDEARKRAYACDVTYGTAVEFGFDYLRDNMKYRRSDLVQRGHSYAIVDEVDSVLIDEARTPLVISGASETGTELYPLIDTILASLSSEDSEVDEERRTASLAKAGIDKVEQRLRAAGCLASGSLFDIDNVVLLHHVNQALTAHTLFRRDRDYIVHNGEVVVVDEVTGRVLPGRRLSDGLHQAIEAKEKQAIQPESRTLASVTIQNYFRMYEKLAGMSATALAEAEELTSTYGIEVVAVPTRVPSLRQDLEDEVFATEAEKLSAVCGIVEDCKERGQPVLVGTTSIEKSERLAGLLRARGWQQLDFDDPAALASLCDGDGWPSRKIFALLNARYHEREALIIAQAGVPGAVTIATNMAGRGIDIQLGGNPESRVRAELTGAPAQERGDHAARRRAQVAALKQKAIAAGGLLVLGTERHDSRRIDDQLRGRSGRQGDPGCSRFVLSLEDDLLRGVGPQMLGQLLRNAKAAGNSAIAHPVVGKAIERAQQRIQRRNVDSRSTLLRFDDVLNDQRGIVFEQRRNLIEDERISDLVKDMQRGFIDDLVRQCLPAGADRGAWDWAALDLDVRGVLTLDVPVASWMRDAAITPEQVRDHIGAAADDWMVGKIVRWGEARVRVAERRIVMALLDDLWLRHVADIEILRRAAPLRAHARRDPLVEFKIDAFDLFERMLQRLRRNVAAATMRLGFDDDFSTQPVETDEEHEVFVPDHLVSALR